MCVEAIVLRVIDFFTFNKKGKGNKKKQPISDINAAVVVRPGAADYTW